MLRLKFTVLALFVALCFCYTCRGQFAGNDQEPFPLPKDPFWKNNGMPVSLPRVIVKKIDGQNKNIFETIDTKYFYANNKLQNNHDIDSQGTLRNHYHIQDDYPAAANQYGTDYTDQAKAYWDIVFQAGTQTTYGDPTTTRYNCFAYTLSSAFINRGKYIYWIDDANAPDQTAAFRADANVWNKGDVAALDVLVYRVSGVNNHATGVLSINCGPPRTPHAICWKYAHSGLYSFFADSFSTPMYVFNSKPVKDQELPAGTWQLKGAGDENNLWPSNANPAKDKVWRANPKK